MRQLFVAVSLALAAVAGASVVSDGTGLTGTWDGQALSGLKLRAQPLAGVTARLMLRDPRTGKPADPTQFALTCRLAGKDGALWLSGLVTAAGEADSVADLVLRWEGVSLPTGNGDTDLLLAAKLVNKLPLCPLRCLADGCDALALAMPADDPYVYAFRDLPGEKAVEMRLPLGFTRDAAPALRRRAPFRLVLFQTNPQWHFRSALAQYYRLFPKQFERLEKRDGGWFFANEVPQIPNPQHYAFFEGQGDLRQTHDRGLGMFPYNETGSETIQLAGPKLPQDYEDAMRQMAQLAQAKSPSSWRLNGGDLDEQVKRGGRFSYRAASEAKSATRHANQNFMLQQAIGEPVIVSAWSQAEGVVSHSGNPNDYSIYVDCLLADGSYQFGQCAVFQPGTHDWQKGEWTIQPRGPLVELRVYAMFRNHTGTAWFDDLRIHRQSKPDENLLENGDFEALGGRQDIQFVHDNALTDPEGRYRVFITDNWGSDVRPTTPLSLLRFICHVDPDLRAPEGRLTPAARGQKFFDTLFQGNPGIDGCYIDGAGAWTCWYISHRSDHFRFATHPLTYDPKTFVIGQHGRFAMLKWLQFIQDRYHPTGKTILGNMGPTTEAWTSYTALDIIGIESSQFQDRALMGYHRFGGYHKPVLPMNFVNLHHLDDRATAEEFVLASAQWGEFPSTGRMVREGYASYGDVCHSYYPALVEMSRAGWEPEPLCEGVRAERFGTKEPLYFTVRAPHDARQADLLILKQALGAIKNPVVMDAVQLTPVPAKLTDQGLAVSVTDGAEALTILRVSSAENARGWLPERAALHCAWGARVRAPAPYTPRLQALAQELRKAVPGSASILLAAVKRLQSEEATAEAEPDSLEKTSLLYELRDAQRALAERLLADGGAALQTTGAALTPVSQPASVTTTLVPGKTGAKLLGSWGDDGRNILRRQHEKIPADLTPPGQPVTLRRSQPGAAHVISAIEVPIAGAAPVIVLRAQNVFFTPVLTARVERAADPADKSFVYKVVIERLTPPTALTVKAAGAGAQIEPAQVTLPPQDTVAQFRVRAREGHTEVVQLRFAVEMNGQEVAQANSEFRNLPMPPPNPLVTLAQGGTATADSSYSGYSPEVAIDGVWETTGLHWTKRAWASQDAAQPEGHWLEIKLPQPMAVSQAWVYWAIDDNLVFSSRDYDVETWDGQAWQPAAQVRGNPLSTVTVSQWPARTTDRVRLHQLQSGGAARRPEIMWVTEVCLY